MNPNLAAALSMGIGAMSVQVAFWLAYDVRLTPLQWTGIWLVVAGSVIAVSGSSSTDADRTDVREAKP